MGWEERRENIKTRHKFYELPTILWTVRNLGTGVIIIYKNVPLHTASENKAKANKRVNVTFMINLLLAEILRKLTSFCDLLCT